MNCRPDLGSLSRRAGLRSMGGLRSIGGPSSMTGRIALIVLAVGVLAGCGDTRKMLGLDKQTPDEFRIINRAPLSLPPDYALRPPDPGAVRPQETTIGQRAIAAVTGTAATASTSDATAPAKSAGPTLSAGESSFLNHVGAKQAEPNIREVVNRENTGLLDANSTFLDGLMFWRKPEDASRVVDPQRESERLRANAALGKSVDEGETPTIQRRKKALLEGIF